MKPFWISSLILTATIAILLYNVSYLESFISPLQEKLQQAEAFARVEDWDTATQMTQEVHDALEKKKLYLNVTLPHNALDQMYLQIAESLSYLKHEKIGEYQASNQMLIHRMNLLYGAESLTLNNLF